MWSSMDADLRIEYWKERTEAAEARLRLTEEALREIDAGLNKVVSPLSRMSIRTIARAALSPPPGRVDG